MKSAAWAANKVWGYVNQVLDGYGLNYNTAKSVDGLISRYSIGDGTLLEKATKTFFFESESSSQTSSRGVYLDPQFANSGINQTPGKRGGSNYDTNPGGYTSSGAVLDDGELNSGKLHLTWKVPYQAGTLEVKAYDKNGKVVAADSVSTSSTPYTISAVADKTVLKADGTSLSYVECTVVDENGNMVPDADNLVKKVRNLKVAAAVTINGETVSVTSIAAKAVIKVPKSKKKAYTSLLKGKGQKKSVKIK